MGSAVVHISLMVRWEFPDTAGRYATDDLAAVGIGASIYFSVFAALMGVLLAP
jgi:hypothetical protein